MDKKKDTEIISKDENFWRNLKKSSEDNIKVNEDANVVNNRIIDGCIVMIEREKAKSSNK